MNDNTLSSIRIKTEARNLGFFACGVVKAQPVDEHTAKRYQEWVAQGRHGDMGYMERNVEKRLNPTLLMEGAKSMICVAMSYAPALTIPKGNLQLAAYAYGDDYHDLMKERLHSLAEKLQLNHYRAFCDTAPVMERYWAVQAGLGWVGRHHQLVIPHGGTMFFLGELLTTCDTDNYDTPMTSRCGKCQACIEACPTEALKALTDEKGQPDSSFDARRCLSYLTIEHRGEIPPDMAAKMGEYIYGCDRCQTACPWNKQAQPTTEPRLQLRQSILSMTTNDWHNLTLEQYQLLFKGSAVKRAKFEGLCRNIHAAENTKPE